MREPYRIRQSVEDSGFSAFEWLRARILGVALSAASFITLVSLIMPPWIDFVFDLIMVGLVAVVGKLARRK